MSIRSFSWPAGAVERDVKSEAVSVRLVADSMLGKLAKWLRVMGCDTHYQSFYRPGLLDQLVQGGRRLLTRREDAARRYGDAILIHADRVGEQLGEVKDLLLPNRNFSTMFTRCVRCNVPLEDADPAEARDNVPEYVFYRNMPEIRICRSCGRYYWPGSHRTRMLAQLKKWGLFG